MDEKKLKKLKEKYSPIISRFGLAHKWREASELLYSDPAKGEFSPWMLTQFKSGNSINDIIPTVQYYHSNRKLFSKDKIQQFSNLKELEDEVKNIELRKSQKQKEISVDDSERTPIWSDENYFLVRINSKKAAQKYGKGSKWCITMTGASYYEQYSAHNILFYFLIHRTSGDKYALTVKRDMNNKVVEVEVYDSEDTVIPQAPEYEKYEGVLITDAESQPENILPKLVNGTASKEEFLEFIEIYHKDYEIAKQSGDTEAIMSAENTINKLQKYLENYPKSLLFVAKYKHPEMIGAINIDKIEDPRILDKLSKYSNPKIIIGIASNPNTPPEILAQLSKSSIRYVLKYVASNPNTPPEILVQLSKDYNRYVANNPNTPPEILAQLSSRNSNQFVRESISLNPNTSQEILVQLSRDYEPNVREGVARNTNTPPEILAQLSKDSKKSIVNRVSSNPKTPPEILVQLSKHSSGYIRSSVAMNPNTPSEILEQLSKDYDEYVRKAVEIAVERNVNKLQQQISKKPKPTVERYYEALPSFPILSKDIYENKEIAENQRITKDVIDELLRLDNKEINDILLKNPGVPEDIKQKMRSEEYTDKYLEIAASINIESELSCICKDLRLLDNGLADKALCAYAAVTDSEKPRVDLSYSYLMRKLRKGDSDRLSKFQKVFKEAFDKALFADIDEPASVALMIAMKGIDFKEDE